MMIYKEVKEVQVNGNVGRHIYLLDDGDLDDNDGDLDLHLREETKDQPSDSVANAWTTEYFHQIIKSWTVFCFVVTKF